MELSDIVNETEMLAPVLLTRDQDLAAIAVSVLTDAPLGTASSTAAILSVEESESDASTEPDCDVIPEVIAKPEPYFSANCTRTTASPDRGPAAAVSASTPEVADGALTTTTLTLSISFPYTIPTFTTPPRGGTNNAPVPEKLAAFTGVTVARTHESERLMIDTESASKDGVSVCAAFDNAGITAT